MLAPMMDRPLLISSLISYAGHYHPQREIVSRLPDQRIHRYGWGECETRSKRLAEALAAEGIGLGDRVATLAFNSYRHVELYFGVGGMGAICHTINPRLALDQLQYIIAHARDRILFVEAAFVPLVVQLGSALRFVEKIVVLGDVPEIPPGLPPTVAYEEFIEGKPGTLTWPDFDERTACGLCYTSGTTGNPKGAMFHHRSTVLHAMSFTSAALIGARADDVICPVVPMFHVNAWGVPYAAAMVGAKLVFAGMHVQPALLVPLLADEGTTLSMGVPTVWHAVLAHTPELKKAVPTLERVVIGGSAAPPAMIDRFESQGIKVIHAWGMTEMSPIGTIGTPSAGVEAARPGYVPSWKASQGRAIYGVDLKVVDDAGRVCPEDGKSRGELWVRGPWIIGAYFQDEAATHAAFSDGWFRTGDIVTIDRDGFMRIVDRAKDLIKSGGEWISSVDVENVAMGHPDVGEAACIAIPDEKWGERPLLLLVPRRPEEKPDVASVRELLAAKLASWAVPERIVVVDALPHTGTGKVKKNTLRDEWSRKR
jgi:acyl-CoA synthetase (AMP-forming)/AMP-acid ligase II